MSHLHFRLPPVNVCCPTKPALKSPANFSETLGEMCESAEGQRTCAPSAIKCGRYSLVTPTGAQSQERVRVVTEHVLTRISICHNYEGPELYILPLDITSFCCVSSRITLGCLAALEALQIITKIVPSLARNRDFGNLFRQTHARGESATAGFVNKSFVL